MLPDYPSLKKEIAEVLNIILRKKVENYLVGLREVQKTRIFEGNRMVMKRKSGEEEESPLMSTEVRFEIGMEEIPKMSIADLLGKIDKVAREMAEKMESSFFKSLNEMLKKEDRTVEQKGEPLSAKSIIQVLDKLFIPFDDEGKAEMPTIFMHPSLTESMKKAITELHEDSEKEKEYDQLMERKWEEFRAQEASRKLVG
jgi:hypothetical protein